MTRINIQELRKLVYKIYEANWYTRIITQCEITQKRVTYRDTGVSKKLLWNDVRIKLKDFWYTK